jgi:uroporphyrinogen III methyltransferase/synthase
MRRPCVFLVGAGPGDPGLISVRGHRYLAAADVVVYDHLVHPGLLKDARADAELIDVGAASPKPLQQEAISYLLAEKAREGHIVVRLKWGDPFVFDDGGKEALYLAEQQVPFEVVPGIPAAIGAPCYAGVPVTYPDAGDVLTLVRGHESEGQELPTLDWNHLANLGGTIVCYAGPRQLPRIIDALVENGRKRDETAAVIYNGTLPDQHTIVGTLDEIARAARQTADRLPAILIVGAVVGLRPHLRWFETRPLFGRRVLVTRTPAQARELVTRLEELGASTIEAPMIKVVEPDDLEALEAACARIDTFQWIVFTSVNSVDYFMRRLLSGARDVRDLKGVSLCAIGPATASKLTKYGLKVNLMPAEFHAEAIVNVLKATADLQGTRVLLPHADIARERLADALRDGGADVSEVVAYRTVPVSVETPGHPDVYRLLLDGAIDIVTFTSASTVRNFASQIGVEPARDLLRATTVACIGPVTADAAAALGIEVQVVPATYTVPGMVDAIVAHERTRQDTA